MNIQHLNLPILMQHPSIIYTDSSRIKFIRLVLTIFTSAGRAFGSGYFCHFAPVLKPRHIRTRPKRLAFCLGSQPKQKLHILPRFCWEPRPYVLLYLSSPPETLGSHHGYTTTPSTTARSETQNERSVATVVVSFIVRAIFESCNHHGTSMFFIHKNVNITLA